MNTNDRNAGSADVEIDGRDYARACTVAELPPGRSRMLYFDEERQIALFNVDGELHAVTNICPHQHSPVIVDGMIEDCTVTCPLHGWAYDLRSGRALGGGARLKTFDVRVVEGVIWVEVPGEEEPTWFRGM
ncbi:MAG TPA: nitrite reductase (NAD(P)H) small subunit [Candidatus Kapabacteria bacterium]|nr:nitrite reductase (NAD(P)H) small subunit [Candidatus Kapabacteria bacterium]